MQVIKARRKGGSSWSRFCSSLYSRFWCFCVSWARMLSTRDIAVDSNPNWGCRSERLVASSLDNGFAELVSVPRPHYLAVKFAIGV
jgi:hypothetical protein